MIFGAALVYLLFLLVIGFWSLGKTRDANDFFLAGKRLGLIPVALATMASIMSGFVFVGGPGLFYSLGLSSFWIIISSSFTGAMMCWVLARPLKEMASRGDCLTIPDVIYFRYGCRFSSGMAGIGILIGVVGYLATQLQALGIILSSMLSISTEKAVLLGIGVLVFYCVAGGMMASVVTDMFQGVIMLGAATLVFFFALQTGGGMDSISRTLLDQQPAFFHPWGMTSPFHSLSWFFVFAVGSLGQPHVVHKFMMVCDLKVLKYFPLILAVSMILCGLIWLGCGLTVKSLVLKGVLVPLPNPDQTITVFLEKYTPTWLITLTYAGILSAIMSTADSFANVGAAVLTRDLPRATRRTLRNEVAWGRFFSLLLFILAFFFARRMSELVAYLGIFGFGTFAAALTPALALGLNWKCAGYWAARSSILFGIVTNSVLEILDRTGFYSLEVAPSALSLICSFLVFLLVGGITPASWQRE